jgi:hypothetical protein
MPSTVIRRFAWRADPPALDVEFVTGRIYRYHGVPEELEEEMRRAFSKGSFFNRRIRPRFPPSACPNGRPTSPAGWSSDNPAALAQLRNQSRALDSH